MNIQQARNIRNDAEPVVPDAVLAWRSPPYQDVLFPALPDVAREWLNLQMPVFSSPPAPVSLHQHQPDRDQQPLQPTPAQNSFEPVNPNSQCAISCQYRTAPYTSGCIAPALLGVSPYADGSLGTSGPSETPPSEKYVWNEVLPARELLTPYAPSSNSHNASRTRNSRGERPSVSVERTASLDACRSVEGAKKGKMIWGMELEDYRSLSAPERKRVRNRISARTFRAKRKEDLDSLRSVLNKKDMEVKVATETASKLRGELVEARRRLVAYESLVDQVFHSAHSNDC